ncbi:MAG: DUF4232 domain-containing protein [Granulicella sp.]
MFSGLALGTFVLLTAATASAATVRPCTANQLSLALDGENGNFTGMSHDGTLLVLRNLSPDACTIPAFPMLIFRDAGGAQLPITREILGMRGMHPGPVVLPAIIAPDAEVTATLRWVAGDVYNHGVCVKPATLSINIDGTEQTTKFGGQLCGKFAAAITFTSTRLQPDPVYKPAL